MSVVFNFCLIVVGYPEFLLDTCSYIEANKSWYKQYGVIPHSSTRQNLLEKILKKDKILTQSIEKNFFHQSKSIEKILKKDIYWHNQLRKAFFTRQNLLKKYWKKIMTQSIEKSFLIDLLNVNNTVYCHLITLMWGSSVNYLDAW